MVVNNSKTFFSSRIEILPKRHLFNFIIILLLSSLKSVVAEYMYLTRSRKTVWYGFSEEISVDSSEMASRYPREARL